jgi:hypothetical protein
MQMGNGLRPPRSLSRYSSKQQGLILMSLSSRSVLTLIGAAALVFSAGEASAYSKRVIGACKADYKTFCPSYKEGTTALRDCMRANGGAISKRCIDALVDAGEVSRAEVRKGRGGN